MNIKFIDLSADFRIENYTIYEKIYNLKHKAKDLMSDSLYSLPELNEKKWKNIELFQIQDVILLLFKFH